MQRHTDLDLFVGSDGTENYLREALGREHPEADSSNDSVVLDEGQALVLSESEATTRTGLKVVSGK